MTINPVPSNYKDVSSANFTGADLLRGKTAIGQNGAVNGEIYERDVDYLPIETPSIAYVLDPGYYRNGVFVEVTRDNFTDCQGRNIRQGKSILGVQGDMVCDFRVDMWVRDQIFLATTTALSATTFASWEPSTTAKTIIAAKTLGTFSADFSRYEYLLHWSCQFDAAYNSGATLNAQVNREVVEIWQALFRRPNSLENIESENHAGNACVTLATVPILVYYNSSGNLAYTWAASYGIYPSASAATFASSTNEQTTVTIKTPAYNARCSNTYFSTARAGELDQANSTIKIKGELLSAEIGGTERSLYDSLIHLYNNPF